MFGCAYLSGRLQYRWKSQGTVVLVGAFLGSFGLLMSSFVTSPWQLYLTFSVVLGNCVCVCVFFFFQDDLSCDMCFHSFPLSQYIHVMRERISLQGMGHALAFPPCPVVVSTWFSSRTGTALGITTAGASIGTIYLG
jgi:hypothetical protein